MKKLPVIIISLIVILFWSALAYATGEVPHEASQGPGLKFVYSVINFVLLVMLLYFFFRNPAKEFFNARSLNTKMTIDQAKKLHTGVYRQFEEIEGRLNNADVESKNLVETIRREVEREKQGMIIHARDLAEKIKADAKRVAEQEVVRARQELKAESAQLAARLAEEKIEQGMTPRIQESLGRKFITQIKQEGLS